jgi:hypothetical protein
MKLPRRRFGRIASEEPAPVPPTIRSRVSRSCGVLIGIVCHTAQMRPGNEVAPSQRKRRGSASMPWPPRSALIGKLRENVPMTVPSRGACV